MLLSRDQTERCIWLTFPPPVAKSTLDMTMYELTEVPANPSPMSPSGECPDGLHLIRAATASSKTETMSPADRSRPQGKATRINSGWPPDNAKE